MRPFNCPKTFYNDWYSVAPKCLIVPCAPRTISLASARLYLNWALLRDNGASFRLDYKCYLLKPQGLGMMYLPCIKSRGSSQLKHIAFPVVIEN